MKAITLRNVPPEVEKLIRERSRARGTSTNRAVLELLLERAGVTERKPRRLHHDLDHLAGSWTKREAKSFERNLEKDRVVDEELWHS